MNIFENSLTINSNLSSFQTGVDALYDMIVSFGVTPTDKTLAAIKEAIQSVHDTAYEEGSQNSSVFNKTYTISVSGSNGDKGSTDNGVNYVGLGVTVYFNPYTNEVSASGGANASGHYYHCGDGTSHGSGISCNATSVTVSS